jgi:hypothetical protein
MDDEDFECDVTVPSLGDTHIETVNRQKRSQASK